MKVILFLWMALVTSATDDGQKTLHDFTVTTIDGQSFPLARLEGKKVLVVNVASRCGLTPQYRQLQELQDKYGKDGRFTVIAFPANDFGQQEPGSNEEIKAFCTSTYSVTFPLMAKISVKGEHVAPLYRWLTTASENGKRDAAVTWNFQKFLVDENGNWVDSIDPRVSPTDARVIDWIEGR